MDRFENMNAFVRDVEAGSISAAADHMDVAKSLSSKTTNFTPNSVAESLDL